MRGLFITGTGTDLGKTFVTSGLVRALRGRGIEALALKPVASGFDHRAISSSDSGQLLLAMARPVDDAAINAISPWRFAAAVSPDMAARLERRQLRVKDIAAFCREQMASRLGPVLIEGAGGAMTPIAEDATCLDLAKTLGIPALLVAGSYLGSISHVLTAIAAMENQGVALAAVVVNETPGSAVDLLATCQAIQKFAPLARVIAMPRSSSAAEVFGSIAQACNLMA